ncbi:Helicobacter pylori protein of uncharacterised function (DUF874) [Helicobacter pylori]|uniref:Protein of uncharacterized function (DUF874) n=1 Tax=Helicobacter pylori TaxID=210 RepID=A0A377IPZ4_HELPX|nr:DUF874 family protein [Helicobacter pylori]MCQ2917507.1 DUF874 family protein [Helicobacter pylori]STO82234.1 Helicobacter pylori protein of uncharacterised function (DUF874) [Helicobacter pylori]
MESVKTGKTNKVGKNAETADTKANKETHFKQASAITNTIRSIGGFFTKIAKKVRELVKKHPKKSRAALVVLTHVACRKAKELDDKVQDKSKQAEKENQINWWKYSGLTIATSLLLAACSVGDIDKQIELEQEKKEAENARDRANKSGIELEQEKQKTINTQKDFIKYAEQNCQENHGQFFIKKAGIKAGIGIEVEAECKTPKPTKTNQTPIQPKHLPNSKQPRSQRGSKAQELIAYLQKELESLPYSQKAIAKQVDFYKPSSIAYLELDPRDFNIAEEWQKENLKIRSKAQAKMLEMRSLKPDPQAHLSTSQSLLLVQKIFADVSKEVVANTEKKVEKAGYGYSKRM